MAVGRFWSCRRKPSTVRRNGPVILPITNGGEFVRRLGFAVPIFGIETTGVVRCDQPRAIDFSYRNNRKVDTLPSEIMDEVLARVETLFQ